MIVEVDYRAGVQMARRCVFTGCSVLFWCTLSIQLNIRDRFQKILFHSVSLNRRGFFRVINSISIFRLRIRRQRSCNVGIIIFVVIRFTRCSSGIGNEEVIVPRFSSHSYDEVHLSIFSISSILPHMFSF